ncbi:MAG: NAD-dependent epimerase/dehydratase family protein [Rhodospirillales bacterium]|nr:NAD-dependent epimerase/dehydratase family protein [Rhodospirillales bacterium]
MSKDPVLITGGSGFIGAAVARALQNRGTPVTLFDQRPPTPFDETDAIASVPFAAGDILDSFSLVRAIQQSKAKRIVHGAAIVGAGISIDGPVRTVTTNVLGVTNVLEAARSLGLGRIVFMGSQSVYGPGRYAPVDEGHPTHPDSPYGVTKLASEALGNVYNSCYGVDFVSLRIPHVYGPGRPSGLRGNVIQDMLEAAQAGRPYRMTVGGDQTKDPTYVEDVTQAFLAALDVPAVKLRGRAYNVALGDVMTWRQVAGVVRELYPKADLQLGPGPVIVRPGVPEQPLGALDLKLAKEVLGYAPRYPIRGGIKHFAAWLEARRTIK